MWIALAVVMAGGIIVSFRLAPGPGAVRVSESLLAPRAGHGAAAAPLSADR